MQVESCCPHLASHFFGLILHNYGVEGLLSAVEEPTWVLNPSVTQQMSMLQGTAHRENLLWLLLSNN